MIDGEKAEVKFLSNYWNIWLYETSTTCHNIYFYYFGCKLPAI